MLSLRRSSLPLALVLRLYLLRFALRVSRSMSARLGGHLPNSANWFAWDVLVPCNRAMLKAERSTSIFLAGHETASLVTFGMPSGHGQKERSGFDGEGVGAPPTTRVTSRSDYPPLG